MTITAAPAVNATSTGTQVKRRTPLLLRVLSLVAFVQFAGHGALFVRAKPSHGPAEVAVVEAMQSNRFTFAASPRSYWDMYFGYGLEAAAICLVEAILFWQLARIAARDSGLVRPIAWLFLAANVGHFVMLTMYFAFPLPMVFDTLIAAGLAAVIAA
jgi:hypothetical protein